LSRRLSAYRARARRKDEKGKKKAGSGFRIPAQQLKDEFEKNGQLRSYLQKYLLANLVQSAQNAACNRLHTISERLARWILTCNDRVQTDHMPLTHEFLARCWALPEPP
jgi:CRP-like cAMP-binding protein